MAIEGPACLLRGIYMSSSSFVFLLFWGTFVTDIFVGVGTRASTTTRRMAVAWCICRIWCEMPSSTRHQRRRQMGVTTQTICSCLCTLATERR